MNKFIRKIIIEFFYQSKTIAEELQKLDEQFNGIGKQLSDLMLRFVNFKAKLEKKLKNHTASERLKASNFSPQAIDETLSNDSGSSRSQTDKTLEESDIFLKELMNVFDMFFNPNHKEDIESGTNKSFISDERISSLAIIEDHLRNQREEINLPTYLFIGFSMLFLSVFAAFFAFRAYDSSQKSFN